MPLAPSGYTFVQGKPLAKSLPSGPERVTPTRMTSTSAKVGDFGHGPSTLTLGDLRVRRLGYGAMRLPGKDVWGEPPDRSRALAVLRRAVELGVNLIDTAWYYGPHVANPLIAEALHPYPKDLVIACKLGGMRTPDKGWAPFLRPEQLREGLEHDLRTLKLERIDVVHLRILPSANVPFAESLDALIDEQRKGRIRHLALSNVGLEELDAALARTPIVAVQNLYNVGGGAGQLAKLTHAEVEDPEAVLARCEEKGIAFLPFFPLAVGTVQRIQPKLEVTAMKHGATVAQVALAWLLARSKAILPIPGTSSIAHLEENWAARKIQLSPEDVRALGAQA